MEPDKSYSVEFMVAIVIGVLIVIMQHREKPWLTRVVIAGCSGGIGLLISPEFETSWPLATAVLVTAFSYAILDIGFGLLSDRALVVEFAKKYIGGGK